MKEIGKNVLAEKIGDKLLIEVDLSKRFGRTRNGEGTNEIVATVGAPQSLGDGMKLNMSIWAKGAEASVV